MSHGVRAVGIMLALLVLAGSWTGWIFSRRPFREELGRYWTSLAERTPDQLANIAQAARCVDSATIEPGQTWSFNAAVGPRNPERGYREAAAFLDGLTTTSMGGGICQVSSTIYNAGLQAGLAIAERHAHFALVHSVPPGQDATVWYGKADLRIGNPYPGPVRLCVRLDTDGLTVTIWGDGRKARRCRLFSRQVMTSDPGTVRILAWRTEIDPRASKPEFLSDDRYRVH